MDRTNAPPLADRMAAGIAFLDSRPHHYEDWRKALVAETFDITEPCDCILGQLDGDYHDAIRNAVGAVDFDQRREWAQAHGFCPLNAADNAREHLDDSYVDDEDDVRELDRAWKEFIIAQGG